MQAKNDAYPFKVTFARFTEYAGKADLKNVFLKTKRKLEVTTHFSKIINHRYL